MSLGEIAKVALANTALGMGTVFCVLILISIGFLRKVDPDNEGGGMW